MKGSGGWTLLTDGGKAWMESGGKEAETRKAEGGRKAGSNGWKSPQKWLPMFGKSGETGFQGLENSRKVREGRKGWRVAWGRGGAVREGGRRAGGKRFGNLTSLRLTGGGWTGRIEGDIGGMGLSMGNERFLSKFEIEQP